MADAGFAAVPDAPRYVLANATVAGVLLDGARRRAGRRRPVRRRHRHRRRPDRARSPRPGSADRRLPRLDLDRGMVWPAFVDIHTHLDKGHIWPRQPNPDGTFMGALDAVGADREANWSAEDVAPAHGVRAALRLCARHRG